MENLRGASCQRLVAYKNKGFWYVLKALLDLEKFENLQEEVWKSLDVPKGRPKDHRHGTGPEPADRLVVWAGMPSYWTILGLNWHRNRRWIGEEKREIKGEGGRVKEGMGGLRQQWPTKGRRGRWRAVVRNWEEREGKGRGRRWWGGRRMA